MSRSKEHRFQVAGKEREKVKEKEKRELINLNTTNIFLFNLSQTVKDKKCLTDSLLVLPCLLIS